jgi:hypothetical protein
MIAVVRLPEMPGMNAVSEMIGTTIKSSQPPEGNSTIAVPSSRQPLLPTGMYFSMYSYLIVLP